MSDMQSMDRENKKRQLRQNIVQMPDNGSEEPMDDGRLAKYRRKKRIIAVATVCFIAALGFTGYRYMNEYEYTGYSVQWERSMRYTENSGTDKKTQVLRLTMQGQTEPVRPLRQKAPALPGREAEHQMRRRPRKLLHRQRRQKRSAIAAL